MFRGPRLYQKTGYDANRADHSSPLLCGVAQSSRQGNPRAAGPVGRLDKRWGISRDTKHPGERPRSAPECRGSAGGNCITSGKPATSAVQTTLGPTLLLHTRGVGRPQGAMPRRVLSRLGMPVGKRGSYDLQCGLATHGTERCPERTMRRGVPRRQEVCERSLGCD